MKCNSIYSLSVVICAPSVANSFQPRRHELAVMSQFHVVRQVRVGFLVFQRVGDVGEPRLFRADSRCGGNGLFDREMRHVDFVLQRIEHEDIEVLQELESPDPP